jgi:hypothetical protein
MVRRNDALLKQISNKVWNATIKIPELKTTLPAFASSFDQTQVVGLLQDMFEEHKGNVLVVTGAGTNNSRKHIYRALFLTR